MSKLALWLLDPVLHAKAFSAFSLVFVGASGALFLRRVGLSYPAACLAALAAMLSSEFFSVACWGLANWCMCFGLSFVALAVLADPEARHRWIRVAIAGSAVGLSLMEGYDVGAIFSLCVAAYIVYQSLIAERPSIGMRLAQGVGTTALVAVIAALVAFHTISTLVGTQIEGVSGMEAEQRSSKERWDWATQWSLPKKEALSVAVPGLFGYRMDTPDGGQYWGQVGRTPGWEQHRQGTPRFIGGGFYIGILVVVVSAWAVGQSLRKRNSVFSETDRKWIWFWAGLSVVALLLAFGRFAPFYKVVYSLPFFSTIRNPVKFMHVFSWAMVVLFAYGVHGLVATYVSRSKLPASSGSWWRRLSSFDRKWVLASGAAFVAAAAVWLAYASSKQNLETYLVNEAIDPAFAPMVAAFSIRAAGAFVLSFGLALALVVLVLSGFFRGSRAPLAGVAMGLFLVVDLGRANQPWIIYQDYKYKYATNPVIELLKQNPHEQRVAGLPFPAPNNLALLNQVYRIEWHQHHFPFSNIQSLDIVQMPRMPEEIAAFEQAFQPDPSQPKTAARIVRRWELTNTRYLLGPAGFVEALNSQVDGGRERFSIALPFNLVPKPGVTSVSNLEDLTAVRTEDGPFAVIEFAGALPRAKLFSQWKVEPDDAAAYEILTDPNFDPAAAVIVSRAPDTLPAPPTNVVAGSVQIIDYKPKRVVLEASNEVPAILLLNDKYDPNWKATIDGQPTEVFPCNVVMRGVFLEPGEHTIEFRFQPPVNTLYITVAAMGVSLLLVGFVVVSSYRERRVKAGGGQTDGAVKKKSR